MLKLKENQLELRRIKKLIISKIMINRIKIKIYWRN